MTRTNRALLIGDSTAPPADWPRTLPAALDRAARDLSRGITYVDDEGLERFQNYRHLRRAAGALGEYLAEQLAPGTPVLIAAGDARVQLTAFWGCVLAGAVPVPVGRTGALGTASAVGERIRAAHELLGHPVVLVDDPVAAVAVDNQIAVGADGTARPLGGRPADRTAASPMAADIALGLLTSGSTGRPKCVLLTHSALAHRAWAAAEFNDLRASDVALNWMPLDHVGGIVMWATQAVFLGCSLVQVDTARVLADPLAWLDLLEAHRAGTTWAPNFGFALVCSALRRAPPPRWRGDRRRPGRDRGAAVVGGGADG
ncbi:AMP-binding protein [Nocardia brasiliensis]|uniref:AMP-binding protein n=1 Tax=Nocardia brasiliensis TaxID=37326 RepID=UPI002455C318|nr:AMP-binding protein [Nocardia brasiliensis]